MKRYVLLSAALHLLVFLAFYLPTLLWVRDTPPPPALELVLPPPMIEPEEEDPTPEETPKKSPTPDLTQAKSLVGDLQPTPTPSLSPTPTRTDKPTSTPSLTPTEMEPTKTPTETATAKPATNTPTAKATDTKKPTPKPTDTKKPTPKPTNTKKPTPRPTNTPGPTASPTPDKTATVVAQAVKNLAGAIKSAEKAIPSTNYSAGAGTGMSLSRAFGDGAYLGRLREELQANFAPPHSMRQGERVVTVYFKILRSGEIVDIAVRDTSGNRRIDEAAKRAVEAVTPFEPLPPGTSDLGVTCEFVVE